MKFFRRLVRTFASAVLWLHALFLLPIRLPSLAWIAGNLHLESSETTVLLLLASLSVLSSYGWWNLLVDSLYIYFFPFIAIFQIVRLAVRSVVQEKDRPPQSPPPLLDVGKVTGSQTASAGVSLSRRAFSWLARPFIGFTVLWGVLIVIASRRIFVWIALSVMISHLVRAVIRWARRAFKTHSWLDDLDAQFRKQAEGVIATIMTASENADEKTLKNAVSMLASLYASVSLLKNRRTVTQVLIAASLIIFGCVYVYLGVLFSFVYYGLARIQSIKYSWPEALVTSLFIPALITDLPRNAWIKSVGGVHWLLVVVGGVSSVIGYMQRRLNAVYVAVDGLSERLADSELELRFKTLSERFNVKPVPNRPTDT